MCSRPSASQQADFRCADEELAKYRSPERLAERDEQLAWLASALSRPRKPGEFRLVVGHFGVFSFRGNGPTRSLAEDLLPLMRKHAVDAYVCGHDHALQVISALPADPLFLVSGAGGYVLHPKLKKEADGGVNAEFGPATLVPALDEGGFVSLRLLGEKLAVDLVRASDASAVFTVVLASRSPRT